MRRYPIMGLLIFCLRKSIKLNKSVSIGTYDIICDPFRLLIEIHTVAIYNIYIVI